MAVSRMNGKRIPGVPAGTLATCGVVVAMAVVTLAAVWLATRAMYAAGITLLILVLMASTHFLARRLRRHLEAVLDESEARFQATFDLAAVGIVHTSLDGRFLRVNRKFCEMVGYTAGELVGRDSASISHPDDAGSGLANRARMLKGELDTFAQEQRYIRKDGGTIRVNRTVSLGRDAAGEPLYFIRVLEDITERRRAEDALRESVTQLRERTEEISRLNAELEQRVRERTGQLELSNQELESFAFSVSHDLRAPLRTIEGFSRILYDEYAGGIDEEGRDCLRRVQSASQRMARLIDALLSLSRITRSRIRLRPVDLSALAREVGDEVAQEDTRRHVELSVEPGMSGRADPSLLRAVFDNLLRNAWKFTARTERAVIEVGCVRQEGRLAYFVRDNGVGFDMSYAGKLFGAFQRLHTEAEFPGTGIGLATVQRIIRRHGGDVWAEAAPGKGAVFYFTLGEPGPAATQPAGQAPADLEAASG